MANPTIVSLAILKANWDLRHKGFLDNFVPIAAECIRTSDEEVVALQTLQHGIQTKFGLQLPLYTIRSLLRLLERAGYVRAKNNAYYPVPDRLSSLQFSTVQQDVLRQHEVLIDSFVQFCKAEFGFTLEQSEAETALLSYLRDSGIELLSSGSSWGVLPEEQAPRKSTRYLVGAFVNHLWQTHSSALTYLDTVVKGNMLANGIFLTESESRSGKFRATEVYFDTPFLMNSLGYAGDPREEPCKELLALLTQAGAQLRCFRHTLEELKGILLACAQRLLEGQLGDGYWQTLEYFVAQGLTASDVLLYCDQLEESLRKLNIRVVDKPAYMPSKGQIDETELGKGLGEVITYRNTEALARDVDSISAIMRLRGGNQFYRIEECRALFVTTNAALARVARDVTGSGEKSGVIPPCFTDHLLTTLLWLKQPLAMPDLPFKRIIADCYAAMQPDDLIWKRYLTEIDKLERAGGYTADDYLMLRRSIEAQTALMESTLGDDQAFTAGTVPEILNMVRGRIQQEALDKVAKEEALRKKAEEDERLQRAKAEQAIMDNFAKEKALRAKAEAEVSRLRAQAAAAEVARKERLHARATNYAQIAGTVIRYAFGVIFAIAIVGILWTYTSGFHWGWVSVVLFLCSLATSGVSAFAIVNLMKGTTVNSLVLRLEKRLETTIEAWLLS